MTPRPSMRTTAVALAAVCAALAARAGVARAADQTILGRTLVVKNPTGANVKRKIVGSAKETASPETLVGDPPSAGPGGGAIVQLSVEGGSPSTQTFVLAQGTDGAGRPFWTGSAASGFLYKDTAGVQGPVKVVKI